MFDHVSIGVRDIAHAKRFYDAVLAPLGYKCLRESPTLLGYGSDGVALWISPTASPLPADPNSGLHFCFAAPDDAAVRAFHVAALNAGGQDNGGPASGANTALVITRRSRSTPTAIGSKRIAALPPFEGERNARQTSQTPVDGRRAEGAGARRHAAPQPEFASPAHRA